MPSDLAFKAMNAIHRTVLALSGRRIGLELLGMPVLELTTTGRRSGERRSVMLTAPVRDGETLVLVGSRGGDDKTPGWVHNIRANPDVEVALQGGPRVAMRARVASAEERAQLWPRVTADHKNYADYQTKTSREIPLVLVEPATMTTKEQ